MLFVLSGIIAMSASPSAATGKSAPAKGDVYYDCSGVYHPYVHGDLGDTPAPRGYKPFYISHVGRHGSRFPVDRKYVFDGMDPFLKAEAAGILTDEGRKVLEAYRRLDSLSSGEYGMLCPLGFAEHKGIASRMAARFPSVFSRRDSIVAVSTYKQRCIMSAASFLSALTARCPDLRIGLAAGDKYYDMLSREDKAKPGLKTGSVEAEAYLNANFDYAAFNSRFFTDTTLAVSFIRPRRIVIEKLFTNGTVASYLGIPELARFLTPEEFMISSTAYNNKMYVQHCGSAEQGEWRTHVMDTLVTDIVMKADAAVAGNEIAADLRFGHDVGLMPFFSLIGLQGYDRAVGFNDALDVWNSSVMMPMGTNLQMVFYRHPRKGGVLVKLLFNEQESSVPALGPGPYYDWNSLREYLVKIIDR